MLSLIELVGYIPAIIFPVATIIQLLHMLKTKTSEGVSPVAWGAFALGNVSLYIYTEKYYELQSIIGLLVTSVLQLIIIVLVFKYRKTEGSV